LYEGTGSNAYPVQEIAITGNSVTSVTGLAFKSDGTKMYATSGNTAIPGILESDLSTAWDVTTATYSQFGTTFDWCSDMWIDSTGTKVFVVSTASDHIGYYTLSTAWDISTISSRVASRSTSGEGENNPQFIFLKPDGTELYYGGTDTDNVFQLGLSTAFDLSTSSHDATFSVATQENVPFALFFNSSGTRMFVSGNQNKTFYQYNLSTAWDLSTASSDSNCPTGLSNAVSGMHIADGKLFTVFSGVNPPQYKAYSIADPDEISSVARNIITNGLDLDGEGGMVWIKGRSNTGHGTIFDTERAVGNFIMTSLSNAESSSTAGTRLTAFNSDGFSLGADPGSALNFNGYDYASWTFRKQPGFFDVVTYTGDGVAGRTVSHNLGSTPGMIIVKRRDGTNDWQVYHRGVDATAPEDYYLPLNQTDARIDSDVRWNDTAPTATEFTVGSSGATNASGGTYVAYLFAHDAQDFGTDSDESIVYCGTYEGNGGTKAVTLGWEPQWCLLKNIDDSSNNWELFDTMRSAPVGGDTEFFEANSSDAEQIGGGVGSVKWYPTSDGFEVVAGGGGDNDPNENNKTYVYVAIRRPHKPASELTANDVFSVKTYAATTTSASVTHDVAFDMEMSANRGVASIPKYLVVDHLRGINGRALRTNALDAESGFPAYWSRKDQFTMYAPSAFDSWWAASSGTENHVSYAFKRTPEFFDIVAYRGTSSYPRQLSHNLGVAPELVIVKRRSGAGNGIWYSLWSSVGADYYMQFTEATPTSTIIWNSTLPTASAITLNNNDVNSGSEDFVAYLFATAPGISKVGSYTGTGASLTIDCGFSSGARFVLIKCTTLSGSSADWYVWDSERGITASVDPYLRLNESNAEGSTASLDLAPDSSGFTIVGTNTNLNGSGEEYIFLAIA
jgi:hypothetical protein